MEGATPRKGRAKGVRTPVTLCPPPRRTSGQKGGRALITSTPLVRRGGAPGGRGTREAQPCITFSQRTRKMLVLPRLLWRFVKVSNHNGQGSTL